MGVARQAQMFTPLFPIPSYAPEISRVFLFEYLYRCSSQVLSLLIPDLLSAFLNKTMYVNYNEHLTDNSDDQ